MEDPPERRRHSGMSFPSIATESHTSPTSIFDDRQYKREVRRIPTPHSEADWDDQLYRAALSAGIELPNKMHEADIDTEIGAINSSMSGVTIVSDNTNLQSSIMTRSTAPTSCSSSERRPETQSSVHSGTAAEIAQAQPFSPSSSKRNSVFRARMRKMVGLKKKDQVSGGSPDSSADVSSTAIPVYNEDQLSIGPEEVKSVPSIQSQKSNWSNSILPRPSDEDEHDTAALKRGLDCAEMMDRQKEQLEERQRFIAYRKAAVEQLARERHNAKSERKLVHDAALAEKRLQDQKVIDELENKHLAEELRMAEEHKFKEQMMNSRLRRIEHFVHNPTPPPPRVSSDGGSRAASPIDDNESASLPVRMPGPADFNHLAEQYRQQKNLVHVNEAKINVLRGQQAKKLDIVLEQKDKEMEALEQLHERELATVDEEFDCKEKALTEIFQTKRGLLEFYWLKYALFEQQKQEKSTGLKFQALPPVTVE